MACAEGCLLRLPDRLGSLDLDCFFEVEVEASERDDGATRICELAGSSGSDLARRSDWLWLDCSERLSERCLDRRCREEELGALSGPTDLEEPSSLGSHRL